MFHTFYVFWNLKSVTLYRNNKIFNFYSVSDKSLVRLMRLIAFNFDVIDHYEMTRFTFKKDL